MKSRELIVWCLLFILAALFIRQCNGDHSLGLTPDSVLIKGETDTVIVYDTIKSTCFIDRPIPYYVYKTDTNLYNITDCDSVRLYADSVVTADGKSVVKSTVRGSLLNQGISMDIFRHDTTFTRVDTLTQKSYPQRYSLSVAGAYNTTNGIGGGLAVGLRRWSVNYVYFPFDRSSQIGASWMLVGR